MEAELADGTILEFPDGTDPQVIQATVKKMLGQQPKEEGFNPVTPRQEGRNINSSIQGAITALQGPSMGFMDELAGVGSAITGAVANLTPWGDDKTIAENYISARDKVRGATEQYSKDYPKTAFGSQIAASMPTILATGGAAAIPKTATFLQRTGQVAKTGGQFGAVSGLGSSEADTAAGVVEDTGKGAAGGAALGALLSGTVSGGGKIYGWLYDTIKGNRAKVEGGKVIRDFVGNQQKNIEGILKSANPNQTTGQALASAGGGNRDEMLALAKIAAQKGDPNAIRAMREAQNVSNKALLSRVSGGATEEASIKAQKDAYEAMSASLDPLRVKGAEAANRSTKTIEMLRQKARQYAGKAEEKVGDVRRFTAAGERATERANTTSPVAWMPRVSGKYTYMGEKGGLASRAEQVAGQAAEDSLKAGASANVAKNLEETIAARGISTLSANPLFAKIDAMVAKVGDRANPVLTQTLNGFKEHAKKFVDKDGNIDAYDLHQLRKNVNDTVDMLFPNADKALKMRAGAVLHSLKPTMDDGLKAAGGGDLVRYFDEFSNGMNKINRMKMASVIQKMTPDELISLSEGNNTQLVEDIFGRGNVGFTTQMGKAANPIKAVASRLKADTLLEQRGGAPAAQNAAGKILEKDMIGFRLPAYMDAKAYTANTILSKFEKWMNEGTREVVFKAMQSPKRTIELMNTLPTSEKAAFLKAMSDPQVRSFISGQTGRVTGNQMATQE